MQVPFDLAARPAVAMALITIRAAVHIAIYAPVIRVSLGLAVAIGA